MWITGFKVQSGFRHEFETEAGTGHYKAVSVFNMSDQGHVLNAVAVGYCNEKHSQVSVQKFPNELEASCFCWHHW